MPATKSTSATSKSDMVALELNPASAVDVLGDPDSPLLVSGKVREFTRAEADGLLGLVNDHGTPLVRIFKGSQS